MHMNSNHRQPNGAVRVATVAAVFGIVAAAVTTGAAVADQRPNSVDPAPAVVGTGSGCLRRPAAE
jgi:hypothetical protein